MDDESPGDAVVPLEPSEREDILADLGDLEVFKTLLEPTGLRGIVVDCEDCEETHYFSWELMRANLQHLLDTGRTRRHEPPFRPDAKKYVTWDYARGYSDGVMAVADAEDDGLDTDYGDPLGRGRPGDLSDDDLSDDDGVNDDFAGGIAGSDGSR